MTNDIKPCPFCGADCDVNGEPKTGFWIYCCLPCGYDGPYKVTTDIAIAAHNRVSDAVERKANE